MSCASKFWSIEVWSRVFPAPSWKCSQRQRCSFHKHSRLQENSRNSRTTKLVSAIYIASIPSLRHYHTVQLRLCFLFQWYLNYFSIFGIHDICAPFEWHKVFLFSSDDQLSEGRDRVLAEHLALSLLAKLENPMATRELLILLCLNKRRELYFLNLFLSLKKIW